MPDQTPEPSNLIRLTSLYIDAALQQSNKAVVSGECDFISLHMSLVKAKELFEAVVMHHDS